MNLSEKYCTRFLKFKNVLGLARDISYYYYYLPVEQCYVQVMNSLATGDLRTYTGINNNCIVIMETRLEMLEYGIKNARRKIWHLLFFRSVWIDH